MKKLLTLAFLFASPGLAWGQTAVQQAGSVTDNSPVMWARDHQVRQAAGSVGDVAGKMITGGFSAVGNICAFSDTTNNAHNVLCMDPSGSLTYNGTTYPIMGGGGNVGGPTPTTINEIASWNSLVGTLLRQGPPAAITGNQTTGSTADGFQMQLKNQTSSDADALYIWRCTIGLCNSTDPGNFDHSRIITVVPASSTTDLQTSQGIYFVNKTGRVGWPSVSSFPAYVGQNIIGICDADGAGCWAGNSIITDKRGQGASPRTGMFLAGWEADFQVNSINTIIGGFITGGSSSAQPASSNGYSCLYLDGPGSAGSVAKWGSCFASQHGSSVTFADVGSAQSNGANVNSQGINMYYRDSVNQLQNISYAATPGGIGFNTTGLPISASLVLPDGAVFATGDLGGLRINNLVALAGNGSVIGIGLDAGWTEVRLGNLGGATTIFGMLNLPDTVTDTPVASLCLNAANQIIKKTTAGSCI